MTYNEWERELLRYLNGLPKKEREEVADYYREMHGDKFDAGMTDEQIIKKFGEPRLVASRILMESGAETEIKDGNTEDSKSKDESKAVSAAPQYTGLKEKLKNLSVAKIVGWFFLAILIVIPLMAVVISVIAAFASVTVTGGAMFIGGIIAAVASPFGFIIGYTGWGVLATAGNCLVMSGVGAMLFVSFYIITKYAIVTTYKIAKYIVMGRSAK